MTDFSDLPPHLIFGKIIHKKYLGVIRFPTKVAVELSFILSKKYWDQDIVSYSLPVIDFDEDDDFPCHKVKLWEIRQHEKFVRFLEGYLEYYREKGNQLLEKLRFRMVLISSQDVTILGRWIELAFERGVKEIEIGHPTRVLRAIKLVEHPLSWMTIFANAKSLTSLKLSGVSLTAFKNTWDETDDFPLLLPSLKTLCLINLRFVENDDSLYKLLHTCSFIEYLSLVNIRFEDSEFRLPTNLSSLRSLEFVSCDLPRKVEAYPLESFEWISLDCNPPTLFSWRVVLDMTGKFVTCIRLAYVKIDDFPSANSFPNLKTISFTEIQDLDLLPVLLECPSLENLSLVKCHFEKSKRTCRIPNSTLKSLEVKHCRRFDTSGKCQQFFASDTQAIKFEAMIV